MDTHTHSITGPSAQDLSEANIVGGKTNTSVNTKMCSVLVCSFFFFFCEYWFFSFLYGSYARISADINTCPLVPDHVNVVCEQCASGTDLMSWRAALEHLAPVPTSKKQQTPILASPALHVLPILGPEAYTFLGRETGARMSCRIKQAPPYILKLCSSDSDGDDETVAKSNEQREMEFVRLGMQI